MQKTVVLYTRSNYPNQKERVFIIYDEGTKKTFYRDGSETAPVYGTYSDTGHWGL